MTSSISSLIISVIPFYHIRAITILVRDSDLKFYRSSAAKQTILNIPTTKIIEKFKDFYADDSSRILP